MGCSKQGSARSERPKEKTMVVCKIRLVIGNKFNGLESRYSIREGI